jgi:hypothetical protein
VQEQSVQLTEHCRFEDRTGRHSREQLIGLGQSQRGPVRKLLDLRPNERAAWAALGTGSRWTFCVPSGSLAP